MVDLLVAVGTCLVLGYGTRLVMRGALSTGQLIIFLLYACYQPLRFSIEDPDKQARYASVFAITCGAFVPLNFLAVRLAQAYTHPRVLGSTGNLPGPMGSCSWSRCSGWRCSSSRSGSTRWPPRRPACA
jgi:hypothetical protein